MTPLLHYLLVRLSLLTVLHLSCNEETSAAEEAYTSVLNMATMLSKKPDIIQVSL